MIKPGLEILEENKNLEESTCFHCGETCPDKSIHIGEKIFCCNGCKTVFEILEQNNLCDYYTIETNPGVTKQKDIKRNFDYLNDDTVKSKLIDFTNGQTTTVTFTVPQMHCSSCIWILEKLYKLDPGIKNSNVDFLKKLVSIKYSETETTLKKIVELLDSIGYLPTLNLAEKETEKISGETKKLYYKIGVAGFSFGNIMLLSFPEYLSLQDAVTDNIKNIFGYLNIILALPVLLYSANIYFISAVKGLRKKIINIDVPIALGIFVLFARSSAEIIFGTGAGFFDSMAALVFFLLVGKLFQNKTYDALNFERNYKSYFPIAVSILDNGNETTIPVEKLSVGQRILIHNNEIIPADSVLISSSANIDYSFVTGEFLPVPRINGDIIYAGGKQVGEVIEVETIKEVSQSYLTQLWNSPGFNKNFRSGINAIVNVVGKYFTFVILSIASITFLYWAFSDVAAAFNAFTAVLIIACPCALALSTPFTLGNTLRIFGKNKFFVRNTDIIEVMSAVTSIVFDKTGTITIGSEANISFTGDELSTEEKINIHTLVSNSNHPLSRKICEYLNLNSLLPATDFEEIPGRGITGKINGTVIKIGSQDFAGTNTNNAASPTTKVHVSINEISRGYFEIGNVYRSGLNDTLQSLSDKIKLHLISGDSPSEKEKLIEIFPNWLTLLFKQTPFDKLKFIKELQNKNEVVMMIGDGLNDAGALKQSDIGITISEDINNFSPACDAILDATSFIKLKEFITFSHTSKKIIILSFIISFIYNMIGLFFAVQGLLSPIVAAILMPVSSISVVLFTTFATNYFASKRGLLRWKLF